MNEAINNIKKGQRAMKRKEQEQENAIVIEAMNKAMQEYKGIDGVQLCHCQAYVYETENFYLLKSYNTFIACMNKDTEDVYDALRIVYGYTPTSAKHIAKFDSLTCYGGYKHSYMNKRYTAR